MSAVPLEWVHGKPLLHPSEVQNITLNADSAQDSVPITAVAPLDITEYTSLRWVNRLGQAVVEAVDINGHETFLSLTDDHQWQTLLPLSEDLVSAEATRRYAGSGEFAQIALLTAIPSEASGIEHPVYRVDFDDWINTTFYLHPMTAEVLKVRSDLWRLFDIFWMLHIMDYETRDNFNNPLLIISAIIALFFTVTGMVLVFSWAQRGLQRRKRSL